MIGNGPVVDVLEETDDLGRLLRTVLESAATALDADAGLVLTVDPAGDLDVAAEQGVPALGLDLPQAVGRERGLLGAVLAHPRLRRGRVDAVGLEVAPDQPAAAQLIAVPLHGRGAVVAVLALLRPDEAKPFDGADERALAAFAVQAQAGIETTLRLQEAQRLAVTDELTGLWNLRYLTEALAREVERAARFGHPLAVLMLDLDDFKGVNDRHGHAGGDAVLAELAGRLAREVRDVDVLARYGGDEFVVVAPETDADGGARLATRLVEAVREQRFGTPEASLPVTACVGVAVRPRDGLTPAELMAAADRAMYVAKATGRDRWVAAIACTP